VIARGFIVTAHQAFRFTTFFRFPVVFWVGHGWRVTPGWRV
jgi:hypothetical protein